MNTLINTWNANEARELSTDELSAVSGGGGQCGNNNGPSWGSISTASAVAAHLAGNVATGGAGLIATMATAGVISTVKQMRD
jgi:bacteriocin-like protein